MAQWLRTLAALPENPGLIISTHVAAHACLYLSSRESDTLTTKQYNKIKEILKKV